jgi:aldehyde:ferredoxin oxidoreductase
VGKSPLTGGWGDCNSGGDFGPYLKFSGYDGVFFTGASDKPVYLAIKDGEAEIRDAAHLWGKDSNETEDILRDEMGDNKTQAACIGPSGEKLALIAAVMNNKGRAAARSGLAAVMGSKKLKAVAVSGSDRTVPSADPVKSKEMRKRHLKGLRESMLTKFGTPALFNWCAEKDDAPTKNWDGVAVVDLPDYVKLGGDRVIEEQERKYACWHCPIACGGHMKEGKGDYKYKAKAHKPEYETLGMFGSNLMNTNLASIIKSNDICNRYGLDTISAGAVIAFAIECYENNIITKEDTDGLEMTWGNHKSIIAMLEKVARREGLGDILADGVKVAAEKIGKGSEKYAMHIGGQEIPAHDPKVGFQWAIAYFLDATPARHCQGGEGPICPGVLPEYDRMSFKGRGIPHKIGKCFSHVYNAAGLCMFVVGDCYGDGKDLVEALNVIGGWDLTMDDLLQIGERIANIRMAFNIREGLNPLEIYTPDRILGVPPKNKGPNAGVTINKEDAFSEFLEAMDWDPKTAKPSADKLRELGLTNVLEALYES